MTNGLIDKNSFTGDHITSEWICDKCRKIVSSDKAVIGWKISVDKHQIPRLIVPLGIYHINCTPRFTRSDGQIALPHIDMMACDGPDGLSLLLDYAEQIPMLRDDFLKLIRRIYIPRYESLNKHTGVAIKKGIVKKNDVVITPFQFDYDKIEEDIKKNPDLYK